MLDKPQILAVDDDVSILYTLTAIADLAGWQLWTAASGQFTGGSGGLFCS